MRCVLMDLMGAFGVGNHNDLATARRNLLHIGERLLENGVEWRNDDHRHLLVDQRYGPVLELARRIAFGADVGDFLELERAFKRKREARSAAEISTLWLFARSIARGSICGSRASASVINRGASINARTPAAARPRSPGNAHYSAHAGDSFTLRGMISAEGQRGITTRTTKEEGVPPTERCAL